GEADSVATKYAKTMGNFPYLEYGLGEDRLGGAKMTNLDTGVILSIIDSVGSRYQVQLSGNNHAYIPKTYVSFDQTLKPKKIHLTKSWHVSGDEEDEEYDYVRIGLETKLPYRSIQQINPHRIVVDIFGTTSNTNWITQLKSVEEIENVYHE